MSSNSTPLNLTPGITVLNANPASTPASASNAAVTQFPGFSQTASSIAVGANNSQSPMLGLLESLLSVLSMVISSGGSGLASSSTQQPLLGNTSAGTGAAGNAGGVSSAATPLTSAQPASTVASQQLPAGVQPTSSETTVTVIQPDNVAIGNAGTNVQPASVPGDGSNPLEIQETRRKKRNNVQPVIVAPPPPAPVVNVPPPIIIINNTVNNFAPAPPSYQAPAPAPPPYNPVVYTPAPPSYSPPSGPVYKPAPTPNYQAPAPAPYNPPPPPPSYKPAPPTYAPAPPPTSGY